MTKEIKFIDLFAGIGGTRIGFESACKKLALVPKCVFSSEIKEYALKVYKENFGNHIVHGDITKIDVEEIPDFDVLLGGFPCQAFSSAGKRKGFLDTRGTLFFEIEKILRAKRPEAFILENVEGLVSHDKEDRKDKMGRTFKTILSVLDELGYNVNYKVLNAKDFGLAQDRKRIYIVGTKSKVINLEDFDKKHSKLKDILEKGLPSLDTKFTKILLQKHKVEELHGKSIKDRRGGKDNIHSWDIGLKGEITKDQKKLLNLLLKERRKKHWAEKKGIQWMDGMPLTLEEISSFFDVPNLKELLDNLVEKGYVRYEHPKEIVEKELDNGNKIKMRDYHYQKEKGYNIVAGKLSFEISKILDPEDVTPTLVATDLSRFAVPDKGGLRRLTVRECLRLFGFPEDFKIDVSKDLAFDLLGNTISVPVVESLSNRLLKETYLRA